MVGMIPKNFLITLIKHHFWLDETQLSERQKAKLPRMYRKLSEFGLTGDQLMQNLEEQNLDFEVTRRKAERTAKPTITQNDWFMREFDKEEVKEYKNF
jgi:hypothetical protein